MLEIHMMHVSGCLIPVSDEDKDKLCKLPMRKTLKAKITLPRNYKFHKKFCAMIRIGYDAFDPVPIFHKGVQIKKNFDRFRKDILIMSGYGIPIVNALGQARWDAPSISFGNMSQEKFEEVYNACCQTLIDKVLTMYTRDDLEKEVNTRIAQQLSEF